MAPSIQDDGLGGEHVDEGEVRAAGNDRSHSPEERSRRSYDGGDGGPLPGAALGPDPVVGAGITLLGIFLMGTGGARDAHYVFDFGVLLAVLGAATFVLCVALSAMKQRRARQEGGPKGADPTPSA